MQDFYQQRNEVYLSLSKGEKQDSKKEIIESKATPVENPILEMLTTNLKNQLVQKIELTKQTKIHGQYDPAHAGRNITYKKLFAMRRYAWDLWWNNKKGGDFWDILFPDRMHQRAFEKGAGLANPEQMARIKHYRNWFANTRASWHAWRNPENNPTPLSKKGSLK